MAKIIVIFSTKGGVGKTTIASNLAVSMGFYSRKKTALIDLDLQTVGDMSKSFDILIQKSMLDLADKLKTSPADIAPGNYVTHIEKYNIDFLPAVLNLRQVAHIDSDKINRSLDYLDSQYEYVIIDAGRAFSETMLSVFNHANLVLLVVTPDVLSVYQTKWSLDVLQSLRVPLNMIKVILNRAQSAGGVIWQEVRTAIACEIISRIPSEGKAMGLALNRGLPFVVDSPKCKASLAIRELEKELITKDGLYLKHQEMSPEDAAKEDLLVKEGEFWKKIAAGQEPSSADETEKNPDQVIELKKRVHQKLIEKMDLRRVEIDMTDAVKAARIREKTERVISSALVEESGTFIPSFEIRNKLIKEIADEALGLGPLEDLINDHEVSDIMVNNKNQIYIERHGKIELSPKRFLSNGQVRQVIERIIAPLGRHIDESAPMVDARLPDGSRVNAIIPPLALTGPTLTIRKFGRERLNIEDLLRLNTLNEPMRDFLRACTIAKKNMVVSGGTGSGKTTFLNVLSTFIPENERIITIEDAAELKLKQEHWVRLESRPSNIEGKGSISIRDIFRNSLRMRPDRIIIGECRSAETLDMLQAMNTGHSGSMTTIHANSSYDVLSRLDSMILMSGVELPMRAIREMIASAVNLIVHTARLSDGSRKITQITEITGMKDEVHIDLQDIFVFKQTGIDAQNKVLGSFQATGHKPTFLEEIKVQGLTFGDNIFQAPA